MVTHCLVLEAICLLEYQPVGAIAPCLAASVVFSYEESMGREIRNRDWFVCFKEINFYFALKFS